MRRRLRQLIELLDGTPAVYGERTRGQAVAELALVTPLLIILLTGLMEIGWFGNTYLTLMDVARASARVATGLQDSFSPLEFEDIRVTRQSDGQQVNADMIAQPPNLDPSGEPFSSQYRDCEGINNTAPGLFYTLVFCVGEDVVGSDFFNEDNDIDDVVISVFSLEAVDPTRINGAIVGRLDRELSGANANYNQVLVVGRYPTATNECFSLTGSDRTFDLRDPFDYIVGAGAAPSGRDTHNNLATGRPIEYEGYDAGDENIRGFSVFGQHRITDSGDCIGSEWTLEEVQDLMNLPNFNMTAENPDQRLERLPGQGLVLVEVFYEHSLLLPIPGLAPMYEALGNPDNNRTTISVWAAFPAPAAEPNIPF